MIDHYSEGMRQRSLIILGIRGVPAAHGGFETFAERLAVWLTDRGWDVTVYCQGSESGARLVDTWNKIRRIHIPITAKGALGTIEFDALAAADAFRRPGVVLTLGYNTGFLNAWLRLRGRRSIINMDGLEYKRAKYSSIARAFLWINERLAAWSGDTLIADHPAIARHLETRVNGSKIAMIPYGADLVESPDQSVLAKLAIEGEKYFTVIARPEPENSILEIVTAFSEKKRHAKLVVLGQYSEVIAYQREVLKSASEEVTFPGPVYDSQMLASLRYYSLAYIHGHRVGGTNPSLVEALGAGNAIIAHANEFNKWVASESALYFRDIAECSRSISLLLENPSLRSRLSEHAHLRWKNEFVWDDILAKYQAVLSGAFARKSILEFSRS